MRKIELLAPAGNKEAFYAAINNGADAIYMGGRNFSARAFADNFDENEIKELVKYAHLRNVKIYITLNTLLNELELKKAFDDVEFYYQNNVDALIIQDLGLYYWIKNNYPDFEIHASTQMHIHNLSGVKTVKELGFKRVVLARESSLSFIKEACKEGIEIETFVHGAICVSYSGQCLLSSETKSRSANKGMCAQCCRLKYQLFDVNNNQIQTETDYLLSPKDMYLLEDLPKLIEAGVTSFKIEGRMKSASYVGYVTSIYRKAIDKYLKTNETYIPSKRELGNLKVLFNRGYTNTFLLSKNEDIFNQDSSNHQGIKIGDVIGSNNGKVSIKLTGYIRQFDGVRIFSKKFDNGFIVNKLYVNNKLVAKAHVGEIIQLESNHPFKKGDILLKTIDYDLEKEINLIENKHLPINLNIDIHPNKPVKITCKEFIYESNIIASIAQNAPLNYETIKKQFSKLNETPYYLNECNIDTKDAFLRISELNSIRTDFINKYNEFILNKFSRKEILPSISLKGDINEDLFIDKLNKVENKINEYTFNNVINIDSIYSNEQKQIISELGGLLMKADKIAYYTMNITNSYAYYFMQVIGFNNIVLSSELNEKLILALINGYKERYKKTIKPFVLNKGNRTLMYIKNNPFKKYKNASKLRENDNEFDIVYHNDYIELKKPFNSVLSNDKVRYLNID